MGHILLHYFLVSLNIAFYSCYVKNNSGTSIMTADLQNTRSVVFYMYGLRTRECKILASTRLILRNLIFSLLYSEENCLFGLEKNDATCSMI